MRIEHIALYVCDLEGARDFFVSYFGAEPNRLYHNRATGFRSYFLSFGDGARLEIMSCPGVAGGEKPPAAAGYSHIAFSAGSRAAVDELTERLRAGGYAVISGPRVTGDGYYESCVAGIEGNVVEITE